MAYYTERRLSGDFDETVERVIAALQDEGFGLLSDIDVQQKFEEKLGLEGYPRYRILGACNPPLAREGLDAEQNLGVLLPCNVIVYETEDGDIVVSAVEPAEMLSVVDNPALSSIAEDVRDRFQRVLDQLPEESN
ncbi:MULTISPECIES: DUF302 domain-containing protein [unclassified Haloferax]|jgi:uncharacterized protein (DUF302 family)|uniref:DUF302 domain-containing protein n=1 Tax=unclassified Haloferax TaxID=2625095 RepID=UPI002876744E|nr:MULTISPECIES: DUF302 domain-containing protein [unclassified Haloferax]MDS0243814.1 DUF302 domain-containing protein [Haloferax sp. S2CR25]MDS0446935.1 DUF302 domain-containing protein [Haloferax sp. S2CR25-2]